MEIKTKFNVHQTVFAVKDDYLVPRVIEEIKIRTFDLHSNDITWNELYVTDSPAGSRTFEENELVASPKEWADAKIQEYDRVKDMILEEVENFKNKAK